MVESGLMQLQRYKSLTLALAAALVICYFMRSAGQNWLHDPPKTLHSEFLHHVIELLLKEAVFAYIQRKNQVITSHDLHHPRVIFNLTPADEPVMKADLLQIIHDTISFIVKTEQLYFTKRLFSRSE
jgi:hypothetical protein